MDSSDEIGEVARAFDQVHREALRLAANEAALRGNVNAMFVNLSRRSQSLVERQIRLIDDLEQGEQDPDRLSSLFQMDHLATRMRRNSENLLVLAGHDATRRWNQPVALVDVLRAAVSEIEQYERVTLNVQPGIAVRGHAVNDVVHLLAELAENATSFSSAETPVVVAGHLLSSGGVLLDITDQGVGMGAEEMAHANWRLDNPPVVDVAVSRRMGLFVVARLAARHGIRVRLRPATAGGLTALVWLPDEVVSHETDTGGPGMRRFDVSAAGAGFAGAAAGGASAVGGAGGLNLVLNGNGDGQASPAQQEINAARAPQVRLADPSRPTRRAALSARAGCRALACILATLAGAALRRPARSRPSARRPPRLTWRRMRCLAPTPRPMATPHPTGTRIRWVRRSDGYAPTALAARCRWQISPGRPSSSPPRHRRRRRSTSSQPSVVGQSGRRRRAPTTRPSSDRGGFGWDTGLGSNGGQGGFGGPLGTAASASSPSGVVVPPAEHVATENRLPIFEAVESDWFRRGRSGVAAAGAGLGGLSGPARQARAPGGASSGDAGDADASWPSQPGTAEMPEPEVTWAASAADQGWEAAAAVSSPSTGGTTSAGLPKRVPQANLVPGTASPEPIAPVPARSASATRDRFASFQRGIREGRAAVAGDDAHSDEDDGSR